MTLPRRSPRIETLRKTSLRMIRVTLPAILATAVLRAEAAPQPPANERRLSIAETGAAAGGTTLNTSAIQSAIDRLAGPENIDVQIKNSAATIKRIDGLVMKNVPINGEPVDASTAASPAELPGTQQIMAAMVLANDYFMKKWPDPSKEIIGLKTWPSNIWTRAVYYEGLMALNRVHPEQRYIDYASQWGKAHKWGLRRGPATRDADNQCCGQTYIELFEMDKNPEQIRDIQASIDAMLAGEKIDDWSWIDAIQMAMPVFAKLGVLTGDPRYFERMHAMYEFTKNSHGGSGLYNPVDRLWWRDKDFVAPFTTPGGKNCYWSRGNGWVVAALVRVLEVLPAGAPHREEYVKMLRDMCEALVPLQREDGFWNASLHDPTDFGGKELTGTALFTYGMAWGINHGLLDKKRFAPAVAKAWNAMVDDALHKDGRLGFVQGTGKEPKDGQPVTFDSIPDFEDYGLGCFLLAGSEVFRLKQ